MPAVMTDQSEQIALDGPLPLAAVVALGVALLALFAWSLRRERFILGKRHAALFGGVRAIALITILWMLLAPSLIRSSGTVTRQTVAVVVDVSGSMQTVDPPGTADDQRWARAAETAGEKSLSNSADRAHIALAWAERQLQEAAAALRDQLPDAQVLGHAVAAHRAVQRAELSLADVREQLGELVGKPGHAEAQARVSQATQILAGADFRRLASMAKAVGTAGESLDAGWRESLADIGHQAGRAVRGLAQLAADAAELERTGAINSSAPDSQPTRLEQVARVLDAFDVSALQRLRETANVRYAAFAGSVTPWTGGGQFVDSLSQEGKGNSSRGDSHDNNPRGISQNATDIRAVLDYLRQEQERLSQPYAAVFLFTDGGHNQRNGKDPRDVAGSLAGAPIYVVPIGNPRPVRDVELKSVAAPAVVMKDDDVVVEAMLQGFDCESESCRIELLRDGAVVQHREVTFGSAAAIERVRFNTRLEETGVHRFQVRVVPLPGELSEENNFEPFEVNVSRNHIRILLADELPRWEYRYLAQLFRRDAKVACDELLFRPRVIATGNREPSRSFPDSVEEWAAYDVVLLGDVPVERLPTSSQVALHEFIRERGGTLVLVAGSDAMPQAYQDQPLAELLPVVRTESDSSGEAADGFAFRLTDEGWKHPALMIADSESATRTAWDFVSRNAPFYTLSEFRHAKSTARILIAAEPRAGLDAAADPSHNALLCWQPLGRGRVVYLASPETYRLRFLRGDQLHYRFWGQLLRWAIASDLAAGTELVSIRTDQPSYRPDARVAVTVRLQDEARNPVPDAEVDAVAVSADGQRNTIRLQPDATIPGRYTGAWDELPFGIYRVEPAGPDVERLLSSAPESSREAAATSFVVREPLNPEQLDTRSDPALAQQIAEITGGLVLPPTALGEVLQLTDLEPRTVERTESVPLWVQWKFLWIVFGCLFSEWAVRKRLGLS